METTLALFELRDFLFEPPQHPIDYLSFSGLRIPTHVKLWHLRNYQKNLSPIPSFEVFLRVVGPLEAAA
jgi:hypothetical protein